jgi:hypothetical protein
MANEGRAPNWRKWKHVPTVTIYEAVALSLNIAPERLRRNPHSWMAGRAIFDEGVEFEERLFVAQRNLSDLDNSNFAVVHYFDETPVVGLKRFLAWAISIGWELPDELAELVVVPPAEPVPDVRGEYGQTATEDETYRTGLAGRPSSWHLIEAECRKRWAARERHPNEHGVESPSVWGSILKSWLEREHPKSVQPTGKTLSNRLSRLLQELISTGQRGARKHRPK